MADYVVTARFEDQTTAGAAAAAAALDKYAQAGDGAADSSAKVEAAVTRVGASADALAKRYDPAARAAQMLARAQTDLATGTATMAAAVSSGAKSQAQADTVLAALSDRVRSARAAVEQLGTAQGTAVSAATNLAGAHGKAAEAAGGASLAHAGFTRELVVLGHEAITGNYSRIPGSLMVLAERSGNLTDIIKGVGSAFTSVGGLAAIAAVAGVAAFAAMAVSAEESDRAVQALQSRLRATRDDYAAMATAATQAARTATGGSGGTLALADAQAAAQNIALSPAFSGTKNDLADLIRLSQDVARAFGEDMTQASAKLAAALKDPEAAAKSLADQGLRGMSQSTVDLIARMQAAGDRAGAQAVALGVLRSAVSGATDDLTPLQRSMRGLESAFHDGADGSESFAHAIGHVLTSAAAAGVDAIASVMRALNGAYARAQAIEAEAAKHRTTQPEAATTPDATGRPVLLGPEIVGSSERAVGMFQLLPSTARGLGVNPMLQDQNIFGGLTYLQQLTGAKGVSGALAQYGGYGSDTGKAAGYIAKVQGASVSSLPADVASQIEYWGQVLGMSPDMIALGQRLAVVESGGRQYAAPGAAGGGVGAAVATAAGITSATSGAAYGDGQALMDQAMKAAGGVGSIGQTRDKLSDTLDLLTKAQALTQTGSEDWQKLEGAIEKTQAAITGTRDPIESLIKGMTDANAPLTAADGAARALADANQKLAQAEEQAGRTATPAERWAVQSQELAKLSAALRDSLAALDRQVAAEQKISDAYAAGAQSTAEATNRVKAEDEARKVALPGTDAYAAAVDALASRYNTLTAAQVDNQSRAASADYTRQLELIRTESALVGATADARAREVAMLQERDRILKSGGNADSAASKAAIQLSADVAAANANLQAMQQNLAEVANMATQAFDQVGQAIATAFASGQPVQWANVVKAALSSVVQEMLKLAVINPLLNSTFGGSRATLDGVVSALNAGSSGSSTGGGFSISSLSSLFNSGSSLSSLFGSGGMVSTVGATAGQTVSPAAFDSFASTSGLGAANGGMAASGSSMLGSLGGGFAGFGIGSTLGTAVGGQTHQGGAMVGAGLGAAVGMTFGPIGGLIGGALGGLVGGMFGPGPAHHGYAWNIGNDGTGMLGFNGRSYVDPIAQQQYAAEQQQVASINQILAANGLTVSGSVVVGGNNNFAEYSSLNAGFNQLKFAAADPTSTLGKIAAGNTFADPTALQTAITYAGTYNGLTSGSAGSLQTQLDALNKTFADAITQAQQYGLATDALAAAQAKQTGKLQTDAAAALAATESGFLARADIAAGNTTAGNLLNFDSSAAQQRATLAANLTAAYGDAYSATADYARIMGELNTALAAERAAVSDAARQAAAGQISGNVTSLTAYANALAVGSASPLSAQDQLTLALRQFNAVAGAAQAGDANSLANLQGYSSTYLTAARAVYGSGSGYASAFGQVIDALGAVGATSGDTLTASVLNTATQKQTDVLAAKLDDLKAAVDALRAQQALAAMAPARVAGG